MKYKKGNHKNRDNTTISKYRKSKFLPEKRKKKTFTRDSQVSKLLQEEIQIVILWHSFIDLWPKKRKLSFIHARLQASRLGDFGGVLFSSTLHHMGWRLSLDAAPGRMLTGSLYTLGSSHTWFSWLTTTSSLTCLFSQIQPPLVSCWLQPAQLCSQYLTKASLALSYWEWQGGTGVFPVTTVPLGLSSQAELIWITVWQQINFYNPSQMEDITGHSPPWTHKKNPTQLPFSIHTLLQVYI